jgi:hypothetical protein
MPAQVGHRGSVLLSHGEAWIGGARPLHEERNRRRGTNIIHGRDASGGNLQCGNGQDLLASHTEGSPAGGQHLHGRAVFEQHRHQLRYCGDDVLAVIEQ